MRDKRNDAVRIKNLDPFHSIIPFLMPKRTQAEVSLTETFDVTDLQKYIKERNETEGTKLKFFHAFCTAAARTIYLRPKMNIYIAGGAYWQRNDISLSFVVKRELSDHGEESMFFLKVKPEMTLDIISKAILGDVDKIRKTDSTSTDDLMRTVGNLPRMLKRLLFWFIRKMEWWGITPASLKAGDPNYSTALLSNLGSIKSGAPYHHLSDYGTCSMIVTVGTIQKTHVYNYEKEEWEDRDLVDATFTLDERIADGFYFAKSLRITKFLLEHPEYLNQEIQEPVPVEL